MPLEQQLNAVMIGLAKLTAYLQARRAEDKNEARKQEAKRHRMEALRLKQLAQQKQKAELEDLFDQWLASPSKQALLKATLKKLEAGISKEEWISWIQDPLNQNNVVNIPSLQQAFA